MYKALRDHNEVFSGLVARVCSLYPGLAGFEVRFVLSLLSSAPAEP